MDKQIQKFLDYLVIEAKKRLNPKKIYLYGSRARGDAREFSDIDIAIEFDEKSKISEWVNFWIDMDENAPILLKIDLVNFNKSTDDFRKNILKDGKIIYERAATRLFLRTHPASSKINKPGLIC